MESELKLAQSVNILILHRNTFTIKKQTCTAAFLETRGRRTVDGHKSSN